MNFWNSLRGMLIVQFTSALPEKTLDVLMQSKIQLSYVVKIDELTYQIQIVRKDYSRLVSILHRRGDRLEAVRKKGIYWMGEKLIHRPILVITILFLLMSSFFLPTRILFVTVEGNCTIPDRTILSAAENCGIGFAASRKLVRSEKMKNALLSAVPQLQWAGINTAGCTAVISVRERVEEESLSDKRTVSNMIADRDGYILSITSTSGTPVVQPGDTVTKGQLLISGYADSGICIRASRAEGEILAETSRQISAVMPQGYSFPNGDFEKYYRISLLIGKKRINLWKDSRISDGGCGRMYEEYFVSLPGDFRLPIAICVDRYICYELQDSKTSEADAQNQMQIFADAYLCRQMVAGQILQKQQVFSAAGGLYKLESSYICTEIIGREQREQIGVINGKRN